MLKTMSCFTFSKNAELPPAMHAVVEKTEKIGKTRDTMLHQLCLIDWTMASVIRSSGPHVLFLSIKYHMILYST